MKVSSLITVQASSEQINKQSLPDDVYLSLSYTGKFQVQMPLYLVGGDIRTKRQLAGGRVFRTP